MFFSFEFGVNVIDLILIWWIVIDVEVFCEW